MTPERKKVEKAKHPSKKSIEACVKSSMAYREQRANSVAGPVDASFKEQLAQALLDKMDECKHWQFLYVSMCRKMHTMVSEMENVEYLVESQDTKQEG